MPDQKFEGNDSNEFYLQVKQAIANLESELELLRASPIAESAEKPEEVNPAIPDSEILKVVYNNLQQLIIKLKEFTEKHEWNSTSAQAFEYLITNNQFSSATPNFLTGDLTTALQKDEGLMKFCLKLIDAILNLRLLMANTGLSPQQITTVRTLFKSYLSKELPANDFIEQLKNNDVKFEGIAQFFLFVYKTSDWLNPFVGGNIHKVDDDVHRNIFSAYGGIASMASYADNYDDLLDILNTL